MVFRFFATSISLCRRSKSLGGPGQLDRIEARLSESPPTPSWQQPLPSVSEQDSRLATCPDSGATSLIGGFLVIPGHCTPVRGLALGVAGGHF